MSERKGIGGRRFHFDVDVKVQIDETKVKLEVCQSILRSLDGFKGGDSLAAETWDRLMNIICTGNADVTRLPFDRDDAAILQAARAIFPNAVLTETVTDLTRAAYMEAPEPKIVDGVSSPEWWSLIEEEPF